MIVGSGVDFEEPDRVRAAIGRHGERFLGRVHTPEEIPTSSNEGTALKAMRRPAARAHRSAASDFATCTAGLDESPVPSIALSPGPNLGPRPSVCGKPGSMLRDGRTHSPGSLESLVRKAH